MSSKKRIETLKGDILIYLGQIDSEYLNTIIQLKSGNIYDDVEEVDRICDTNMSNILYFMLDKTLLEIQTKLGDALFIKRCTRVMLDYIYGQNKVLFYEIINSRLSPKLRIWNKANAESFLNSLNKSDLLHMPSYFKKNLIRYAKLDLNINQYLSKFMDYIQYVKSHQSRVNNEKLNKNSNILLLKSFKMDKKQMMCGICVESECVPSIMSCGHKFCLECLVELGIQSIKQKENITCPMCKCKVTHATIPF